MKNQQWTFNEELVQTLLNNLWMFAFLSHQSFSIIQSATAQVSRVDLHSIRIE